MGLSEAPGREWSRSNIAFDTPQEVMGVTIPFSVVANSQDSVRSSARDRLTAGERPDGQLGNGTTGGPDAAYDYDTPQAVTGITYAIGGTSLVNAPYDGFCVALSTGGAECWGDNTYGQLGNGTTGGPNGEPGSNGYDRPQVVMTA